MDKNEKDPANSQFVWHKEIVLKLIEMWREHECLYDPKHEHYHNRRVRHNALKDIADYFKDMYPEIGPFEVKHKISYIRGQYTREISRAKEKNRSGGEEVYVPSVFWFSEMGFLKKFIYMRKGSSKIIEQSSEQVDDSCDSSQRHDFEVFPAQASKRVRLSSDTPVSSRSMSEEKAILLPQTPVPPSSFTKNINEKDAAFCNYIKMELNEITNKNIKDDLIEKITLAVFDAKKEQRLYSNNFEEFC